MMCYVLFYGGLFWLVCANKIQDGNSNSIWAGYAKVASSGPDLLRCIDLVMTWPTTKSCITEGLKCQILIINLINHNKYIIYYYIWNLRFLNNEDLCKLADELRGVPSHAYCSWWMHALGNNTKDKYCSSHLKLANSRPRFFYLLL